MILFIADNHYGVHPGKMIHEVIKNDYEIDFHEDSYDVANTKEFVSDYELVILNSIGDTCGVPHAGDEMEMQIKAYVEAGKNILLLHGASAAFWKWSWWREIVGLRWVRANDPEQITPSTHPVRPYKVTRSKTRHPLVAQLKDLDLPEDEIYINLEQMGPVTTLMETKTDEGTFTQCYECITPYGGKIVGFIPGHALAVTQHEDVVENIKTIINYLK